MTPPDDLRTRYAACLARMAASAQEFFAAVREIRDERLYCAEYSTFDEFCHAELGMTPQRVGQLIAAQPTIADLETIGFHLNERQARELKDLTPEQQRDVMVFAKAAAPDGNVTAAIIRSTRNVLEQAGVTGGYVDVGDGEMSALTAALTAETYERAMRQREHIRAGRPPALATFEGVFVERDGANITLRAMLDATLWDALATGEIVRVVVYSITAKDKGEQYEQYDARRA